MRHMLKLQSKCPKNIPVRATLPPSMLFADGVLPAKGIRSGLYLMPRVASFIHYPLGLTLG